LVARPDEQQSTMAGTLPPLFTISDDDHGGYVAVAAYTLLVLMVVLVATRVFTRWYVVKFIKADDVLLTFAAVRNESSSHLQIEFRETDDHFKGLGVVQTVFVQLAIDHGLARTRATVSDSDFELYEKVDRPLQHISAFQF
jgi:hypothetical protein